MKACKYNEVCFARLLGFHIIKDDGDLCRCFCHLCFLDSITTSLSPLSSSEAC